MYYMKLCSYNIIYNMKWSILYWITIVNITGTVIFIQIPNKSNFPKEYIIPLIMSLIIKYSIGDLDKGYQFTYSDIFYWAYILGLSYIIVRCITPK